MNNRLNIYYILCLGLLLVNAGCTQETPVTAVKPSTTMPKPSTTTPKPSENPNTIAAPIVTKPVIGVQSINPKGIIAKEKVGANFVVCNTINKTLPENTLALPSQNITAFIGANDSTKDSELGESHRLLEIKSSPNCEVIFSQILPINVSADFPYYLAKDARNEALGLIGIRGFHSANVFEVPTKKIFTDLKPQFLTDREAADATSGMISHLFFDQNFLYGYAVDYGVFVFDMKQNGRAVLPIAEFSETQLFGLNRGNNQIDIIIPIVTFNEEGMLDLKMKNVFEKSVNINPALKFKLKEGKYILFKEKKGIVLTDHLVVDMEKKERFVLPKDVKTSSIEKILEYLK